MAAGVNGVTWRAPRGRLNFSERVLNFIYIMPAHERDFLPCSAASQHVAPYSSTLPCKQFSMWICGRRLLPLGCPHPVKAHIEPVILDPTSFSFVNALTISPKRPEIWRGGGGAAARPRERKVKHICATKCLVLFLRKSWSDMLCNWYHLFWSKPVVVKVLLVSRIYRVRK